MKEFVPFPQVLRPRINSGFQVKKMHAKNAQLSKTVQMTQTLHDRKTRSLGYNQDSSKKLIAQRLQRWEAELVYNWTYAHTNKIG